jgi:hypothetical protein
LFLYGNSSIGVNTPSSGGKVYFANGQTDRILVPYSVRKAITLIVEVANAGGTHMILVVLTVSLVPTA